MRNGLHIAILVVAILAGTKDGFAGDVRLEPVYIEQTTGLFSVCALDTSRSVILKYTGFEITSNDVPTPSPYHTVLVYRLGERPSDTDPWKPSPPTFYAYGPPKYPIEEVDPPFETCLDPHGVLFVGFHLRGRFYAVTNAANPRLNAAMPTQYWSRVIMVSPPPHRKEELSRKLRSVLVQDQGTAAEPGSSDSEKPNEASTVSVEPRLQEIKEEYHLMGLWFTNNQVTVCTGMLTSEQMKSLQGAIHKVVGQDVKVFTIIK